MQLIDGFLEGEISSAFSRLSEIVDSDGFSGYTIDLRRAN